MSNREVNRIRSEFVTQIESIGRCHGKSEVLRDFIRLAADDLDLIASQSESACEYRRSVYKKYTASELSVFVNLYELLCEGLSAQCHDFIGSAYMELDLGNSRIGQFFSPDSVARLKSQMIGNFKYEIDRYGFYALHEPACGAGSLVIATANTMAKRGCFVAESLLATCWEIDHLAADMAFVQLSLLSIPAEVVTGNTLSGEVNRVRYTPLYYMNDFHSKVKFRKMYDIFTAKLSE